MVDEQGSEGLRNGDWLGGEGDHCSVRGEYDVGGSELSDANEGLCEQQQQHPSNAVWPALSFAVQQLVNPGKSLVLAQLGRCICLARSNGDAAVLSGL